MSTFTDLQTVIYALADKVFPARNANNEAILDFQQDMEELQKISAIQSPKVVKDGKTKTVLSKLDRIVSGGFLTRNHAARLICFTKNKAGLFVSFREAGAASISLINQGYACKGHDILSKSIKQNKKTHEWTWTMPLNPPGGLKIEDLTGLIGCYDPEIDKLSEEQQKAQQIVDRKKILYGIMAAASPQASEPAKCVPLAQIPLTLIKKAKADQEAVETAETDTKKYVPPSEVLTFYTGDYDMHDLHVLSGGHEDYLAQSRIVQELADAMAPERALANVSYKKNPRAVVRHGAQTNYVSFTLSNEVEPKEVAAVIKKGKQFAISRLDRSAVAMFNSGKCYILDTVQNVAAYYKANNLNNGRIPCYYYLQHLYESLMSMETAEPENDLIKRQDPLIREFVNKRSDAESRLQKAITGCPLPTSFANISADEKAKIKDLLDRAQAFLSYLQARAILSPNA